MNNKTNIAIFPNTGLGDAIIILVLAQNLLRNGYEITLYHNTLEQLAHWLPQFNIKKRPAVNDIATVFEQHDFIISGDLQHIKYYGEDIYHKNKHKHAFHDLNLKRLNDLSYINSKSHHDPVLNNFMQHEQKDLCFGTANQTYVTSFHSFCQNELGLKNCSAKVPFTPPNKLLKTKYQHRVIIQPNSSKYQKDWSYRRFVKLADKLSEQNFEAIFSVSPDEYADWRPRIPQRHQLTPWNLAELASNLYQAQLFIGNDSGPGHLASFLQTPTVTVFPRHKVKIPNWSNWCPGYAPGKIVSTNLTIPKIKLGGTFFSLVSVNKVLRATESLLAETMVSQP